MGLFTERDEETPNEIIIGKLNRIEAKLDAVIKAMHDYDDDNIYKGYDEPNVALLKAAGLYNEELNKEYGESSFEAFKDDEATTNTNALNIVGVKYPISQKQYNLNRDKMANDHYELGGEG
jgi:hypothetical protein